MAVEAAAADDVDSVAAAADKVVFAVVDVLPVELDYPSHRREKRP